MPTRRRYLLRSSVPSAEERTLSCLVEAAFAIRRVGREGLSSAALPRPAPAPLQAPPGAWRPESLASRRVGSARAMACGMRPGQPEPLQDRVTPHGWMVVRQEPYSGLDKASQGVRRRDSTCDPEGSLDLGAAASPEIRYMCGRWE